MDLITNQGYKLVLMPEHPNAQTNGYVFEHVHIALKKFGFDKLPKDSCVHHINLNIKDNSEANLDVCKISKHMEYHSQLQYHAASFLIGNGLIKFNSRDGYYYNNSDLLPKLTPQKIPKGKNTKALKKENHPNARKGWIAEHVYIALKTANQDRLRKGQAVHHIDLNKENNSPENLAICSKSDHGKYHKQLETFAIDNLFHKGLIQFQANKVM